MLDILKTVTYTGFNAKGRNTMNGNYYKTNKGSKAGDWICSLSLLLIIVALSMMAAKSFNSETIEEERVAEQLINGICCE
tara:strand:+ start:1530 stop:1769 length:240 start_codon:yes stop_codon:yes gene_type:complete